MRFKGQNGLIIDPRYLTTQFTSQIFPRPIENNRLDIKHSNSSLTQCLPFAFNISASQAAKTSCLKL